MCSDGGHEPQRLRLVDVEDVDELDTSRGEVGSTPESSGHQVDQPERPERRKGQLFVALRPLRTERHEQVAESLVVARPQSVETSVLAISARIGASSMSASNPWARSARSTAPGSPL